MKHSETISKISEALSIAQSDIAQPHHNRRNKFFDSTYSSLDVILAAIKPEARRNGLSFVQSPEAEVLVTVLMHTSGEWLSFSTPIYVVPKKAGGQANPQEYGSAVTYARRYALCGLFGLYPDEDDDGELNRSNAAARVDGVKLAEQNADRKQREAGRPIPADPERETHGDGAILVDAIAAYVLKFEADKKLGEAKGGAKQWAEALTKMHLKIESDKRLNAATRLELNNKLAIYRKLQETSAQSSQGSTAGVSG